MGTLDHVDEVVDGAVVVDQHVGVVDFVLGEDVLHYFLVEVAQLFGAVQFDSSEFGGGYAYLGRVAVQPDPYFLQLPAYFYSLLFGFGCFEDHQHHIRIFGHCDNLPAPSLSLGCAFDDSGQIQQLDFGVVVVDDSGDAGQGGELICG